MRLLAVLLVWLMGQVALAGGAADVVAAALADARKLPPELRKEVRYLSLHNLPEADRPGFLRALAFHVNSLSREAELVVPTGVSPDLLRVSFIDHGWKREVWEKLAPVEPYFHLLEQRVVKEVEIKAPVAVPTPAPAVLPEPFAEIYVDAPGGGIRKVPRSAVQPGEWVYVRRNPGDSLQAMKGLPPLSVPEVPRPPPAPPRPKATPVGLLRNAALHAPWLGKPEVIAELATLLDSEVPIVRADWFLYRTSQQVGRGGAGYYDFLGLSSRKDAEELAGLDVKTAQRVRREMAALVDDSGVALNNRQVVWYATVAGSWWETLDADASTGKKNALRLYDGDYTFDAAEVYFTLPSGMWGLLALDNKGNLQDTVPDSIASDGASRSNDRRIHAGLSCVRCHSEGIRPIDDWARATYAGPVAIASPDPVKLKRLRQLYLSDLPRRVKRDNADYAEVLARLNGLTPAENAREYALAFENYLERKLSFEDLARELSTKPEVFRKALETYATAGNADQVLAAQLARKPRPMRREHAEELHALMQAVLATGGKLK